MAVADVIGDALYRERHENLVCVRDIELYSLCEHHLLPFFGRAHVAYLPNGRLVGLSKIPRVIEVLDRKSTRLNSSHGYISYAVFCLKKKKKKQLGVS